MYRLSPTPIVYTGHSLLIATVLPLAGVPPTIYMVHALLLSPTPPPVSPIHGGTFLAGDYCTSSVQHKISNHSLSLVPSCFPLYKAALDQQCCLDLCCLLVVVCCLHWVCHLSEIQTIIGHLQAILMKLSKSNHCVNTGMACVEDFCQVQYLLRFTCSSCLLNCFLCITFSKLASTIPMNNRWMVLAPVHEGGTVGSSRSRYLLPYASPKTLGHFKEPAGTQRTQCQDLLQKSDGSTAFLWSCSRTREEVWTHYYSCCLPKVCSSSAWWHGRDVQQAWPPLFLRTVTISSTSWSTVA